MRLSILVSLFGVVVACGSSDGSNGGGGPGGGSFDSGSCVRTDTIDGDVRCSNRCSSISICNPPDCSLSSQSCEERGYTRNCSGDAPDTDWFVQPGLRCESPAECSVGSHCQTGCCVQSQVTGLGQCRPRSDCDGTGGTGGSGGGCQTAVDCLVPGSAEGPRTCEAGRCVCSCPSLENPSVCCGGSLCSGGCLGSRCC